LSKPVTAGATPLAHAAPWDLGALLDTADPRAPLAERHLWLVRLLEWVRQAPLPPGAALGAPAHTPAPVHRLRYLLDLLDKHPEHRARVTLLLQRFWTEVDVTGLLADFGFASRMALWAEFRRRVQEHVLPRTPATLDLGELFGLLLPGAQDAAWIESLDAPTLQRLAAVLTPHASTSATAGARDWRTPFFDAIMFLSSAVRAAGFSSPLRQRMSPALLAAGGAGGAAGAGGPFAPLARMAETLRAHAEAGDTEATLQDTLLLRALLDACRLCALSIHDHLEAHGVSVDVVFEVDQLVARTQRIEALLSCVLSPAPAAEVARLVADLTRCAEERRSVRALFGSHYSLLARKVAERSAETGEHYITRDRSEYRAMLRAAAGGGLVLVGTTFAKFALMALTLSAFWAGFWAGANYALSFVIVQMAHFTVATKQPAMTAPAMAAKLGDIQREGAVAGFVDEVAHLIRSQAAGVLGNLAVVAPMVLGIQWLWRWAYGAPLVGAPRGEYVLHALTLLGPTAFYAAFTGVLLFASSLIAGWVENWFVWHRLDSALAWNPRIRARLGAERAQRWAQHWRHHISGYAANISLGFMLGIVPVLAAFFGLPLDVRHVTLSTGQLAASVGALGWEVVQTAPFWWCVAGIAVTGVLNVGVSFGLAFAVALRSRGIRLADRSRITRAIRARLRSQPLSFLLPPKP
jgi:site-specific recombinase